MNPMNARSRVIRVLKKVPLRVGRVILAIAGTATCLFILLSSKTGSTTSTSAGLPAAPAIVPAIRNVPSGSPKAPLSQASHGAAGSGGPGHASAAPKTVAGDVTQTIHGPVQVAITIKSGRITAVSVPVYPSDQQISSAALPQLIQETIATDSANINAVSGATYTSQGYISSLQSAIDKAGR
jgi:uncharacterized protein with FMN-binding domain